MLSQEMLLLSPMTSTLAPPTPGMALGLVGAGVTGRCNPEGRNWKEFHRVIGPGSWFELVVDAGHAHFVFPPQPWRQAYR